MSVRKELTGVVEEMTRLVGEVEDRALKTGGLARLTVRQLIYVELISKSEPRTVNQLAEELGVAKPTVTVAVTNLQKKGYIRKIQSKEDKRVYYLYLTTKGKVLAKEHDNAHQEFVEIIMKALKPDEIEIYRQLLRKILNQAEASIIKKYHRN